MGRAVLVLRLATRDLRRRPAEAALLLLAITAAAATLTLGLVLHGVTDQPYQSTRAATAGPDVVAQVAPLPRSDQPVDLTALQALAHAPGVTRHSGPYPIIETTVAAHGHTAAVQLEGRAVAPAAIDHPKVTDGSWVRAGGVVVERSFADAFDLGVGDRITVGGRAFRVAGVAVTAAMAPYPSLTTMAAHQGAPVHPGLLWATVADAHGLAPDTAAVSYVMNLALADPAAAPAFVDRHRPHGPGAPPGSMRPSGGALPPLLQPWQQISDNNANLVRNERRALLTGSWLLGLLALASVAVLVGGRMADQMRRVGLLKAAGASPQLIAAVLLAQYVVLALLAAAAGLAIGRLAAPLLAKPSTGLLGGAGTVPFTISTIALVAAAAVGVAVLATLVPGVRAARTGTVQALANAARPPRRTAWLITLSSRLPVPLLLGLRLAARRPRRTGLCVASVAITVSGIIAALGAHAQLDVQQGAGTSGLTDPRADRLSQVLALITIMLIVQAAVNAIVITWATVLDAKRSSALARALGATPLQVTAGLSAAQVLPALAGAIVGVPGGIGLLAAVSPDETTIPGTWWLLATLLAAPILVAALTALPAHASARHPIAEALRAEAA